LAVPRVSVVVPVYNVEEFLETCLDSLAAQTFEDFEAILVDDGSTDRSGEIAQRYAERDPRFRVVRQENGGLSKARNTGADEARGEFLVFLDSDDALPPNAYELLVGALDQTGSDFATGNVYRLTRFATFQSPFLAKTFPETQLKTHVTKFRPLLADRPAWNKMWRRSFWDEHGFRFPEGRTYEDTPVTVPAHFLARSVDVISEPVYYWRIREGVGSITQRKLEPRGLTDRLLAIEEVSDHLARKGPRGAKRWYDESVVADDLRYYVNGLEAADDEYRQLFLDRVNAFLDKASPKIFRPLPAIERLKWHLVRRRLVPELLEVLRFQKEELSITPPVRVRGKWYGDYPFRNDRELKIPSSIYRVEHEFYMRASLERLERRGDELHVRGHAYIHGVGAGEEGAQRVRMALLRRGRLARVRLITSAVRLRARSVERPELTGNSSQALTDLSWAGFEATLDPRALRRAGRWREGTWELYVTLHAGGLKRRRSRFTLDGGRPLRPVEITADGAVVTAGMTPDAELAVEVHGGAARLREPRLADGAVELGAELSPPPGSTPVLELRRTSDGRRVRVPLRDGEARAPLGKLRGDGDSVWELWAADDGRRVPVALPDDLSPATWTANGRQIALTRRGRGAALVEREPAAVVRRAGWAAGGTLELEGELPPGAAWDEIEVAADRGEAHVFPLQRVPDGKFSARLPVAAIESLAGALPLSEGRWRLRAGGVPIVLSDALDDELPLATVVDRKPFSLGLSAEGEALLSVHRDLGEDERGRYNQLRLRETAYKAARGAPLRDAVVYTSFLGRQYSDSPRAIHEELVRRDAPLEHLWVVRDGRCRVPDTATVLPEGSREYHEALATARFVVANDHFPDWFRRRPEQICLQTWHGTPLKKLGFDVSDMRKQVRRFQRGWERQLDNWQYVLSPNRFSTPILRRAYAIEGEMLETGYPRVDVLAGADRDERGAALRRRLGIPEGVRTVLYAPTYRDHVVDRRGRYRLDLQLDLARLRQAVGEDTVILFRKHHYVVDSVPHAADGFVRDVSSYPDGTELMLAADVLVTDYSSMMVDYANTGRPMLFYTYDLDAYGEEIRGFYLDFVATVPGPLLRTTDEVAEALRDLDGVRSAYDARYAAFRETFCELDDGHAASRVVDCLLSAERNSTTANTLGNV
jgi:CDP-glycerol glycerophosphotransferase